MEIFRSRHLQNTTRITRSALATMLTSTVTAHSSWELAILSLTVVSFYAYIWILQDPLPTSEGKFFFFFFQLYTREIQSSAILHSSSEVTQLIAELELGPSVSNYNAYSLLHSTTCLGFLLLCNEWPQTGQLKTIHIYYLLVSVS